MENQSILARNRIGWVAVSHIARSIQTIFILSVLKFTIAITLVLVQIEMFSKLNFITSSVDRVDETAARIIYNTLISHQSCKLQCESDLIESNVIANNNRAVKSWKLNFPLYSIDSEYYFRLI